MARATGFSTAFLGVLAVALVVAAGAGLLLTDDRAGRLGGLEVWGLGLVGLLLVVAVVAGRAHGGGWPLVVAAVAFLLLLVLAIVSLSAGGRASAALLELAALVMVFLFITQLRHAQR